MTSGIDWLTLTIKPESPFIEFDDVFSVLSNELLLGDLLSKMVPVRRIPHYDTCLGYENVTFGIPTLERYRKQGFCLLFSSQGLDFFFRYLSTYNITLRDWLGRFRSLCFEGFITRCTRFDYKMDDVCHEGEKPTLTMQKVISCARKGEMCKKARVVSLVDGEGVTFNERFKTVNGEPLVGRTLNVGSRYSDSFCRFYDKLAEQLQKKQSVPEDVTSWTRCELEFKDDKAMGCLNAFIDYDDEGFSDYMCGVVNNYVSFIFRSNKNISRCPVKRWWTRFLNGCTKKFRLPHKLPARSAYAKAKRGLNQYLAILYTLHKELGLDGLVKFFQKEIAEKFEKNSQIDLYKADLAQNIRDGRLEYEKITGYKYYAYNSQISPHSYIKPKGIDYHSIRLKTLDFRLSSSDSARLYLNDRLKSPILRRPITYFPALVEYNSNRGLLRYNRKLEGYELERHLRFMDGQEVLE